ncbi:hypothetical protein L1987_50831 [Smallanthus sonchifolius]|uniref:Uncharacterized protein n=1 Tax=Smallanthus sonchifolius TaxID=185202 RepID=A0ACB9EPR9_9ASTR|nr:hypothetical protein L1987_50831 [Smallanthus sonchifolius]
MSPGEVESPLESDQNQAPNNNDHNTLMPQLGRQSSIYSLTLDEFQHTLNESGKNFGSMNMDEFLNNIWTAEENQAQGQVYPPAATAMAGNCCGGGGQVLTGGNTGSGEPNMIGRQLSLTRQASLTLPGSLSRKTVDEVWSEIQKIQKTRHDHHRPSNGNNSSDDRIPDSPQPQPTYGEMTLEDFLVKAGVVREQNDSNATLVQQLQTSFELYSNESNRVVGPSPGSAHMVSPMMGLGTDGGTNIMQTYSPFPGYPGGKQASSYQQQRPPCYPHMVGNGGCITGGYGQGLGTGSPASPVSSDDIATSQLDSRHQYGMDMGGIRGGRKRIFDGPVEKVVERRQRRMIKNRESAARSRARKQAYTVELEAELNMLKDENAHLKQALAEIEREKKQQFLEVKKKSVPKGQKVKEKSRVLRRTSSCST